MKNLFLISVFLFGIGASAQSFTVSFPDTIVYGPAIDSSALSCWTNDDVINVSGTTLALDVVRVQNVTPPGWSSAFCFQVCSQPSIDSIRAIMAPSEVVNIAVHFIITGVPDSSTILMKFKNANNPAEVIYQRFYGISQSTAGVNALFTANTLKLYPNPLAEGSNLNIELPSWLQDNGSQVLLICDMSGRMVWSEVLTGTDILSCTPAILPGIYTLSLQRSNGKVYHSLLSVSAK